MKTDLRKEYLAMASRRASPGSGSGPLVLRERSAAYGAPPIHFLKGKLPFVVVGGLATRLYMPERMTLDTDILVLSSDASRAEDLLTGAGCKKTGPLLIGGSTWTLPDGRPLAMVVFRDSWVEDAVRNPIAGKDGLPYIALPYLVLMKLKAGRLQDLADIGRMLGCADDSSIHAVKQIAGKYRPEDLEDLDSLIRLGKLEYGKPD